MLASEKLAIAAHLHVLLRRKTGRVTDTQWLADNAEYAAEIIRFSRCSAQEDGHTDLLEWANKLEIAMLQPSHKQHPTTTSPAAASSPLPTASSWLALPGESLAPDATPAAPGRYVRGLR